MRYPLIIIYFISYLLVTLYVFFSMYCSKMYPFRCTLLDVPFLGVPFSNKTKSSSLIKVDCNLKIAVLFILFIFISLFIIRSLCMLFMVYI